jgi:hypothetical protein
MIAKNARHWAVTAALMLGAAAGAAGIANAASGSSGSTSSTSSSTQSTAGPANDGDHDGGNPATMNHGPGETLLTGSTLSKARAAALAAVPGATVIRIETDSAGAAYEAHLQKADGSFVTVKFDKNLNVTATDDGFGGGPA